MMKGYGAENEVGTFSAVAVISAVNLFKEWEEARCVCCRQL